MLVKTTNNLIDLNKKPEQAEAPATEPTPEKPLTPEEQHRKQHAAFFKMPLTAQDLAMAAIERAVKSGTANKAGLLTRILDNHPEFLKLVKKDGDLYPKAVDACQRLLQEKIDRKNAIIH